MRLKTTLCLVTASDLTPPPLCHLWRTDGPRKCAGYSLREGGPQVQAEAYIWGLKATCKWPRPTLRLSHRRSEAREDPVSGVGQSWDRASPWAVRPGQSRDFSTDCYWILMKQKRKYKQSFT